MKDNKPVKKAYRGNKKLSQSLDYAIKPICQKKGIAQTRIITDWHNIIGKDYAIFSQPRKIKFPLGSKANGILHIEVYDSSIAMQISYIKPQILEKLATYFGYKAICDIKIFQKPIDINCLIESEIKPYKEPLLDEQSLLKLDNLLTDIEDANLKKQLSKFGKNVFNM